MSQFAGSVLRQLLEKRYSNQRDAAEAIGEISQPQLSRVVSQKRPLSKRLAAKIADKLDVSIEDLYSSGPALVHEDPRADDGFRWEPEDPRGMMDELNQYFHSLPEDARRGVVTGAMRALHDYAFNPLNRAPSVWALVLHNIDSRL